MWMLTMTMITAQFVGLDPDHAPPIATPSGEPLVKDVLVEAALEDVWLAWTTEEGLQTFFAPSVRMELRPGGPFEALFDPEAEEGLRGSEGCRVLSFVEGEMLSFNWNAPAEFIEERGDRTVVVLQFTEVDEDTTRLKLVHDGWKWKRGGRWSEVRDYFDGAWDGVLSSLLTMFQEGPRWSAAELERARIAPPKLQHFAYFATPAREDFIDESTRTKAENEGMRGHVAHLNRMLGRDQLVFAGPYFPEFAYPETPDGLPYEMPWGAVFVVRARTLDDARLLMEGDPMIAKGFWKACVHPFALAIAPQ